MSNIDDKINALPENDRVNYLEALRGIEVDGFSRPTTWLSVRDFKSPYSREMVKIVLYAEMFEGDTSRLHGPDRRNPSNQNCPELLAP
jgi:hypothetical protein